MTSIVAHFFKDNAAYCVVRSAYRCHWGTGGRTQWVGVRRRPFALAALLLLVASPALAQVPAGYRSLYADPKPGRVGDVVTILLAERTSAQRQSTWGNASNASMGGAGSFSGGTLAGQFGTDASFNRQAKNRNNSAQSDLLSGTITALVVDVDSTGNLRVEGERRLKINGESHVMRVKGLVRPIDIAYSNTVLSHQIADAHIEYRRAGIHRKFLKPAVITRLGVIGALGAAVVFALL